MRRARRSTRYMEIARVEQVVHSGAVVVYDVDVTIRCKGFEGSYRLPLRIKGLGSFFPQFLHIGSPHRHSPDRSCGAILWIQSGCCWHQGSGGPAPTVVCCRNQSFRGKAWKEVWYVRRQLYSLVTLIMKYRHTLHHTQISQSCWKLPTSVTNSTKSYSRHRTR